MRHNDLTVPETRLAAAIDSGHTVDLRSAPDEAGRTVRAEVLAELVKSAGTRATALRLRGARISGHLNLGGRHIRRPLELRDCEFTGKVFVAKVHIPELSFRGSHFPHGISGRGLRVDGALNLTDCRFDNRLYLKRLRAEIVFLDGVRAKWLGEYAIQLRGADITQELYCRNGFTSIGRINLYGAKVGGQVIMDRAQIDDPGGTALLASNLEVGQDLHMRDLRSRGCVKLLKAKIGGDLSLTGAVAVNPGRRAVNIGMAQIGQNLLCGGGFQARGEVNLFLTHVDGRVEFDGARLFNPGGVAFGANRIAVGHSVMFNDVAVTGEVAFDNGRVEGQLSLNRTTIDNSAGTALCAVQCEVGQSLWLDRGSRFTGVVDLSNMRIGNRFRFTNVHVSTMRATDLSVDILDDDPRCWPDDAQIGGMHYASLPDDARGTPQARIAWLARLLPGYAPQPYTQLLSVYRKSGSATASRMVMMAREKARRRNHRNHWRRAFSTGWSAVLDKTIGFGYAPWRAIPWIGGFFIWAWVVFGTAPRTAFTHKIALAGDFHPPLHALDCMLPVMQLGSRAQFVAHDGYVWWEAFFAASGWFFGLVVAAGVAGVFRRD